MDKFANKNLKLAAQKPASSRTRFTAPSASSSRFPSPSVKALTSINQASVAGEGNLKTVNHATNTPVQGVKTINPPGSTHTEHHTAAGADNLKTVNKAFQTSTPDVKTAAFNTPQSTARNAHIIQSSISNNLKTVNRSEAGYSGIKTVNPVESSLKTVKRTSTQIPLTENSVSVSKGQSPLVSSSPQMPKLATNITKNAAKNIKKKKSALSEKLNTIKINSGNTSDTAVETAKLAVQSAHLTKSSLKTVKTGLKTVVVVSGTTARLAKVIVRSPQITYRAAKVTIKKIRALPQNIRKIKVTSKGAKRFVKRTLRLAGRTIKASLVGSLKTAKSTFTATDASLRSQRIGKGTGDTGMETIKLAGQSIDYVRTTVKTAKDVITAPYRAYRKTKATIRTVRQIPNKIRKGVRTIKNAGDKARNAAKRTYQAARFAAQKTAQIARYTAKIAAEAASATARLVASIASNPYALAAVGGAAALIVIVSAISSSGGALLSSVVGSSSYIAAENSTINEIALYYQKALFDWQYKYDTIKADNADYDEYIYHNPYPPLDFDRHKLIAYLTCLYEENITIAQAQAIFEKQCPPFTLIPETQTRTQIVAVWVEDENAEGGGYWAFVEEEYEYHILHIIHAVQPFESVIIFDDPDEDKRKDQQEHFEILVITKGLRQFVGNPLGSGYPWPLTGHFGWRYDPLDTEAVHMHRGTDIGLSVGTPLYSAVGGIVTLVNRAAAASDYGVNIIITGANGSDTIEIRYGHCSAILKEVGDSVTAGDLVALSGNTGKSTGPHLHFEIIENGVYLDPEFFAEME